MSINLDYYMHTHTHVDAQTPTCATHRVKDVPKETQHFEAAPQAAEPPA